MTVAERIGQAIKRRREEIGLDVAQLAREAKVSRTTIYNLEEGRTKKPHAQKLAAIERALDDAAEESTVELSEPDAPPPIEQMEIVVEGRDVKVTVKGPISDHAQLESSATVIARGLFGEGSPKTP